MCEIEKRLSNKISKYFNAEKTVLFNSSVNAVIETVLTLARTGDEIVVSMQSDSKNFLFFNTLLRDMGINTNFVNGENIFEIESEISYTTRFIFLDLEDLDDSVLKNVKIISNIAHRNKIPLILYVNTEITKKLDLDFLEADIVILDFAVIKNDKSLAGGSVTEHGKIDWRTSNIPLLKAEDPCYDNIRWAFDLPAENSKLAFSFRLEKVMRNIFDSKLTEELIKDLSIQLDFLV